MSKLICCQGLPGSGKSNWSAQQQDVAIVSKDDIRRQLREDQGWEWSQEGEKMVIWIRDARIQLALSQGKTVISSDTNFGKHIGDLKRLAVEAGAEFEIRRFDVRLDECLRRNAQREGDARIPDQAIIDMYNKYVILDTVNYPLSADPQVAGKVEYIPGLPNAVLVDLDGTLCIHNGRGPFEYDKCGTDLPNIPVIELVEILAQTFNIIFMSGREDSCREMTEWWLYQVGFGGFPLYMRSTGDYRKDVIVKKELFDANIRGKFNVAYVLDDRPQVLRGWRELGLFTLAVGDLKEF